MKKEVLLIAKDENVCNFKPLFDSLQRKELNFLDPIDVTSLVDLKLLGKNTLPAIYLWNQVSDPNLGIHDFIKVEESESAEFKWIVVDGEIFPIEDFCSSEQLPSQIELLHVMNNVYQSRTKTIEYFVAEGCYEGNEGIHFCLVPFNDELSCQVLEILFGSDFIKNFQNGNLDIEIIDLNYYFNPDAVEYCYSMYIQHFESALRLVPVS